MNPQTVTNEEILEAIRQNEGLTHGELWGECAESRDSFQRIHSLKIKQQVVTVTGAQPWRLFTMEGFLASEGYREMQANLTEFQEVLGGEIHGSMLQLGSIRITAKWGGTLELTVLGLSFDPGPVSQHQRLCEVLAALRDQQGAEE